MQEIIPILYFFARVPRPLNTWWSNKRYKKYTKNAVAITKAYIHPYISSYEE